MSLGARAVKLPRRF